MLAALAHAKQRRDDQAIGVGFGEHAATQAAADAIRQAGQSRQQLPVRFLLR